MRPEMETRILLVEDESNIADALKFNLEQEGYSVTIISNGKIAIEVFEKQRFDLVILDLMLPGANGFDVLESIRIKDETTPVLIVSAKYQDTDKIKGLKIGADDYLTKPFNLEELLLRIQRLLKRSTLVQQSSSKLLVDQHSFGENTIFFSRQEAKTHSGSIVLTAKETEIMKLLIQNDGEVVSRETILSRVWGYDVYPTTRTIDNFIARLRKYFETDPGNPKYIHSIRGVGYKFTGV